MTPRKKKIFRIRLRVDALAVIRLDAGGIDVGAGEHCVAFLPDRDCQPVRRYVSILPGWPSLLLAQ
jgi:hypothetical protein